MVVVAVVAISAVAIKSLNEVVWPPHTLLSWRNKHPDAPSGAEQEVSEGLKEWFVLIKSANPRMLGMTSVAIDDLWHEIILDTKFYAYFCETFVGFFVHHTTNKANSGIDAERKEREAAMRTWMSSCYLIGEDPYNPTVLPRLFRLDEQWNILNGHYFKLANDEITESNINYICPSTWINGKDT